jgi:hypothetical protein
MADKDFPFRKKFKGTDMASLKIGINGYYDTLRR